MVCVRKPRGLKMLSCGERVPADRKTRVVQGIPERGNSPPRSVTEVAAVNDTGKNGNEDVRISLCQ
jgi:hypothetical protein